MDGKPVQPVKGADGAAYAKEMVRPEHPAPCNKTHLGHPAHQQERMCMGGA